MPVRTSFGLMSKKTSRMGKGKSSLWNVGMHHATTSAFINWYIHLFGASMYCLVLQCAVQILVTLDRFSYLHFIYLTLCLFLYFTCLIDLTFFGFHQGLAMSEACTENSKCCSADVQCNSWQQWIRHAFHWNIE